MLKPVLLAVAGALALAAGVQAAAHGVGATAFDVVAQTPSVQPPEHDHTQHEPALEPSGPATAQPRTPASKPGMTTGKMEMHQRMMAEMAADAKLEALVKQMHSATGEAKLDFMAQVIDELVRQRKAAHGKTGMPEKADTMSCCGAKPQK